MNTTLEEKFRKYIRDNNLAGRPDRILLAVSGGVDSMVMLSLFVSEGYDVGVAHCNFQLRGEESDEDDLLVQRESERLGVPCYLKRFDTKGEMEATGESVQIAARRLRYTWFSELSKAEGYSTIAIAHHGDDSIETFFINLMRGTGLKGLTGISRVRGNIIRPLLFASRREILDYAHAHKIPYREDSSNKSTKYLRNKIRLGIVPVLRDINPKFTELMGENIDRITDAQIFVEHCIASLRDKLVATEGELTIIDPAGIPQGMPINFVIYELLSSGWGFRGPVVDELCESLSRGTTGRRFYSPEWVAYTDRGRIVLSRIVAEDDCMTEIDENKDRVYFGNSIMLIVRTDIDNVGPLTQPDHIALLDADKLKMPLTLRRWREGDSFVPLGMDNHKKVSDFLIDGKVSMAEKARQFVLMSGDDIVWLVGRRIDDRYKIGPGTENILKIIKETV